MSESAPLRFPFIYHIAWGGAYSTPPEMLWTRLGLLPPLPFLLTTALRSITWLRIIVIRLGKSEPDKVLEDLAMLC